MSNVYCLFCWREIRPRDPDGCNCRDHTPDEPDPPEAPDDQGDVGADRDYEARKARAYEREQQRNDQARWD
jgi:hypothetical protein